MRGNTCFERQYQCQFPKEDSIYLRAWTAYHEAADRVDGHLHPRDRSLAAGMAAMGRVLSDAGTPKPRSDDKDWQAAKREAVRRLRT